MLLNLIAKLKHTKILKQSKQSFLFFFKRGLYRAFPPSPSVCLSPFNSVCGLQHSPLDEQRATVPGLKRHGGRMAVTPNDAFYCLKTSMAQPICCAASAGMHVLSYVYCPDFIDTHTFSNHKNVFCIIISECAVLCYWLPSYPKDMLFCPICVFCLILQSIV